MISTRSFTHTPTQLHADTCNTVHFRANKSHMIPKTDPEIFHRNTASFECNRRLVQRKTVLFGMDTIRRSFSAVLAHSTVVVLPHQVADTPHL